MLEKSNFRKHCDRQKVDPKRSQPQIKNGDILLTYIGNLTLGKTDFEAVREFDDDPDYYKEALGIVREIPSAETLRQRMDDIGDSLRADLIAANEQVTRLAEPGAKDSAERFFTFGTGGYMV
jgi:hypothetical protein